MAGKLENKNLSLGEKLHYTRLALMANRVRFALNRSEEDLQFKRKCERIINIIRNKKDVDITFILEYKKGKEEEI